jgi:hypothetical protein
MAHAANTFETSRKGLIPCEMYKHANWVGGAARFVRLAGSE